MKLINYDYGFTPADPTSGTYYRGKIRMTYDEYREAVRYLRRARFEHKFMFAKDLERTASVRGNGFHVCVRVSATEKLVKRYGLKGYKRQNYFIHVTPK